jgi:EAL and modified HD-GYP domain-containing signal transduction protein
MGKPALARSVCVVRQPIFHRAKSVHGYELLFRAAPGGPPAEADGDEAIRDLIASAFIDIGLEDLTGGRRGFVPLTRTLLLEHLADLLPPDLITLEVLDNADTDADVADACRRLKAAGYTIAMDDFALAEPHHPLLDLADIVKIDVFDTDADDLAALAGDLRGRGIRPLATSVETEADFVRAEAAGCEYVQGSFFSKPIVQEGKVLEGTKLAYLRLLEEVHRPEMSLDEIEETLKQDVALAYKLLQFINSVWFGLRYEVTSLKRALVMLGPKEIRKWFALVSLRQMGTDKPDELFLQSAVRAKMGEGLAAPAGMADRAAELFLMGMFSVIDALLDTPMETVLAKLPLDDAIKGALLGRETPYRPVYDLVAAYEAGDWPAFAAWAGRLGIDTDAVPPIYAESLKWANAAFAQVNVG